MSITARSSSHTATLGADIIERFAEISGDDQAIHLDEEAAAESVFGEPIAHGMLTASLISAALGDLAAEDEQVILLEQKLQYVAPVPSGETVHASADVAVSQGDDRYYVDTVVSNASDEPCVTGYAIVIIR